MTDTAPTTQETPISPRFARLAIAAERYILPWIYGFLAWQWLKLIRGQYQAYHLSRVYHSFAMHAGNESMAGRFYADVTKNVLLFVMMIFTGLMLLISRRPAKLPDKLKHVIVPIAMSFYFLLYGMHAQFPPDLRENLLPAGLRFPAAVIAVILSIIGYSISLWALFYLRRSFSILVSVREVVSGGPYKFVRHPIYLGYLFDLCGLLLATGSLGMLFLAGGFLLLLVHRARLEEEKLSDASEDYRLYTKRTGFLLPQFPAKSGSRSLPH